MPANPFAIAFGAALGGALFGILTGFVLHRIVGAYIEGSIGPYGCILSGSLFLALAGAAVVFHSWVPVLIMSLLVALTPLLNRRVEKAENRRYYTERIEQCVEAIKADPRNLAARSRAAEALYKLGRIDEAIEQYSEIVRVAPRSIEETHRLKQLIRERDERRDPMITCPMCGQKNPGSRLHCANCEASLAPVDRLRACLEGASFRQFVRMFSIAIGCLTLIILLGSLLSAIGRMVAIAVVLIALLVSFVVSTLMN